jgi:hypothetical protein
MARRRNLRLLELPVEIIREFQQLRCLERISGFSCESPKVSCRRAQIKQVCLGHSNGRYDGMTRCRLTNINASWTSIRSHKNLSFAVEISARSQRMG